MSAVSDDGERLRQAELRKFWSPDRTFGAQFADLAELARRFFVAPVGLITLIDADRQWCIAAAGVDNLDVPRHHSFCTHAIAHADAVLVVEDALADERFAGNPLVHGAPGVRFYAGAPVVTDSGAALGTICVIDTAPRGFDAQQRDTLARFAGLAKALLELHQRDEMVSRRNEFHALYEHAPGFIATAEGPDHRFTFANASYERFVGRTNLVGRTVAEALPEMRDQGFIALLDQVYRTGKPYIAQSVPMQVRDPASGQMQQRYASFVYQPVRDADGVITGLFCEGFDATEQHEAATALAALQGEMIHRARVNVMGMMATTLAHELNHPLSAIDNYAEGMLRLAAAAPGTGDHLVQALHGIREASHRAALIIRNLREMTRRREPLHSVFDLKLAADECVRLVAVAVGPAIRITNRIDPDIAVRADRIQIQQVIINLVRNACDAVVPADTCEVWLSARSQGDRLTVSVHDSGTGVAVEAAEHIFSWSISSKEAGMGFGLTICRMIIEAHHGRIWLENSGPGGSEFCFSVPVAAVRPVTA
jgi:signal transduction histidine kinase